MVRGRPWGLLNECSPSGLSLGGETRRGTSEHKAEVSSQRGRMNKCVRNSVGRKNLEGEHSS